MHKCGTYIWIIFAFLGISCDYLESSNAQRDVTPLLDKLEDAKPAVRDSALAALKSFVFVPADLPQIYAALDRKWVDDVRPGAPTRRALLDILLQVYDETTPAKVEHYFPELRGDVILSLTALRILANINSEASIASLKRILLREPDLLSQISSSEFEPLVSSPQHLGLLFPEILTLAIDTRSQLQIYHWMEIGLASESLDPRRVQDHLQPLQELSQTLPQQLSETDMRSSEYPFIQQLLNTVFRCLSHFPIRPEINQLLTENLTHPIPETRLAAIQGCIQAGIPIDSTVFIGLAQLPGYRTALYDLVQRLSYPEFFPQAYANQEAFAESDLVNWLAISQGKMPARIELLEKRDWQGIGETGMLYVYRFRYTSPWQVGISGPQPVDSTAFLTTAALTGSLFERYRKRDLDALVEKLLEQE